MVPKPTPLTDFKGAVLAQDSAALAELVSPDAAWILSVITGVADDVEIRLRLLDVTAEQAAKYADAVKSLAITRMTEHGDKHETLHAYLKLVIEDVLAEDLLRRKRGGDQESYEELHRGFGDAIRGIAFGIFKVTHPAALNEIVCDVIDALSNTYDLARGSFRGAVKYQALSSSRKWIKNNGYSRPPNEESAVPPVEPDGFDDAPGPTLAEIQLCSCEERLRKLASLAQPEHKLLAYILMHCDYTPQDLLELRKLTLNELFEACAMKYATLAGCPQDYIEEHLAALSHRLRTPLGDRKFGSNCKVSQGQDISYWFGDIARSMLSTDYLRQLGCLAQPAHKILGYLIKECEIRTQAMLRLRNRMSLNLCVEKYAMKTGISPSLVDEQLAALRRRLERPSRDPGLDVDFNQIAKGGTERPISQWCEVVATAFERASFSNDVDQLRILASIDQPAHKILAYLLRKCEVEFQDLIGLRKRILFGLLDLCVEKYATRTGVERDVVDEQLAALRRRLVIEIEDPEYEVHFEQLAIGNNNRDTIRWYTEVATELARAIRLGTPDYLLRLGSIPQPEQKIVAYIVRDCALDLSLIADIKEQTLFQVLDLCIERYVSSMDVSSDFVAEQLIPLRCRLGKWVGDTLVESYLEPLAKGDAANFGFWYGDVACAMARAVNLEEPDYLRTVFDLGAAVPPHKILAYALTVITGFSPLSKQRYWELPLCDVFHKLFCAAYIWKIDPSLATKASAFGGFPKRVAITTFEGRSSMSDQQRGTPLVWRAEVAPLVNSRLIKPSAGMRSGLLFAFQYRYMFPAPSAKQTEASNG